MAGFTKYDKVVYAEMEKQILTRWKDKSIFQASVEQRPQSKKYVFYDGPPFITGLPHHGTLLSSIVKDVIPRFKTMQGYRVERRWGWDCHGLPAENLVEKKLKLKDKKAVMTYGLERYITACRENMIQTGSLWEESIDRIGRWVEFQNAYKTMDADYMESVWWVFKTLYDKGKIYEGEKVLMYCLRCATPVSKAEIAMDNSYKDVVDTSVYVKFALLNESIKGVVLPSDTNFLAWTTTPWTLPANTALAVNPAYEYALVKTSQGSYILAQDLVETICSQGEILATFKGQDLLNLRYKPLLEDRGSKAHRVLGADYVHLDEGSGVVHLAPAYGEEDYDLAIQEDVLIVRNVDDYGCYIEGQWQGLNIWQAGENIMAALKQQDSIFKTADIKHSYPHCYRCQTRLIYKAHPSWFLNVDQQRTEMLVKNQLINWFPKHIKDRRFADIIKTAPDWNISRDRLWATPLPVWRGQDPKTGEEKTIVVGSYAELTGLSGQTLDDYHRPWVDEIKFEKDGVLYQRVDKVLDCWFESGSMPYAQHHYPFENREVMEANFPADFIIEYVGQVRAWFYYLHVLSVALFDKPSFLNVIVTGTILGTDGRKISKSLGNYTDPAQLIDSHSADAYRLALIDSPVLAAEDFILSDRDVADKQRKLNTLRNSLEFFLLYASADNWQAGESYHKQPPDSGNLFDCWLLQRLSDLQKMMTNKLEAYNLPATTKPLLEFIDDLSNWYVRRNRKRFWKTDNDADKDNAYHTLYFVLYQTAHLIAPICPFLAEDIYLKLNPQTDSVHLENWPQFDYSKPDIVDKMTTIRHYVTQGLAMRAEAGIKVRQPLACLVVYQPQLLALESEWLSIILEELNVKHVDFRQGEHKLELDTNLTDELRQEGMVRDLVRQIQVLRKQFGLEVENRINLQILVTDSKWQTAIKGFTDYIKAETLAIDLSLDTEQTAYVHQQEIKLEGVRLSISLAKI